MILMCEELQNLVRGDVDITVYLSIYFSSYGLQPHIFTLIALMKQFGESSL